MRRIAGLLVLCAAGCAADATPGGGGAEPAGGGTPGSGRASPAQPPFDPVPFVDPLIGTGGHGHTFPGATVPFGMVQLSPDTRLEGWDGCSGYHHDDEWIYGFSHTHLSGTGCSDYGDVLVMPGVGAVEWNNGADGKPGYRQRFRHADETATAGAYGVVLGSGVKVELTATTRVGVHRITFPAATEDGHVLIDLSHRDKVIESGLRVVGDREVRGFRRSTAWARDQHIYFVARFSRPFTSHETSRLTDAICIAPDASRHAGGEGMAVALRFASSAEPVVVTVGISGVDEDGAARNLDAEMPGFDFDAARSAAQSSWRRQLDKVEVRGGTDAQRRTFYSALYRCCIAPNVWGDADGRYRGRDGNVHVADGWTQHTVFSLWDTFRALHPLMTIVEPARTNDWIRTFLAQHREGGALPVWELAANETDCMIGYHAVPVIADAWVKGIRGYDAKAALAAMVASADRDVRGLPDYRAQGFVPSESEGESVSKTLEYAYDDWCIAEMARGLGDTAVAARFDARAQAWKNLFDPATGFFRPRRNQAWVVPFDPAEVNFHLTEANSWQYSAFVPHDLAGLRAFLGGPGALSRRLDAVFTAPSKTTGREQADITGLIGQYAHGNEPSHHMAYLHACDGEPWKTQARVRQILDTLYSDRPDGLCGNEDCGQMSAWYVMSALGFYPVCPGVPEYVVGAPLFPSATIRLDGGRTFEIVATGSGPYVQSAALNGAPLDRAAIPHAAIVAGGRLEFVMGEAPSRWGDGSLAPSPITASAAPPIVPVPVLDRAERTFREPIDLAPARVPGRDGAAQVRVSTDGGKTFTPWTSPLRLDRTTDLAFLGVAHDGRESRVACARFVRIHSGRSIVSVTPYAPQYAANGRDTLIDGLTGGTDFRTGDWQGWQGTDVVVEIDLGEVRTIRSVRCGFLQDMGSWIWMPSKVTVQVGAAPAGAAADAGGTGGTGGAGDVGGAGGAGSGGAADGAGAAPRSWWITHDEIMIDTDPRAAGGFVRRFETSVTGDRARFVRITAHNRGPCPAWHPGAGGRSWIFADEFEVETE